MSMTIWGNPLTASNTIAIEDARCQIKYPGIFVSDGKHFYSNYQPKSGQTQEDAEKNDAAIQGGVVCWSIFNTSANRHRIYCLYTTDFYAHFWSIIGESLDDESITSFENVELESESYVFGVMEWYSPVPVPLIDTYYVDSWPSDDLVIKVLSQWLIRGEPISYAQKPFNLNILNGDVWNFIVVEPGAWFYSIYDDSKNHHMYFLAGDEFKLLEFRDADGNGVIPHTEHHSTPIVLEGKRYHCLYRSWAVDSVCPFPTQYYKHDEFPSDEQIYLELTDYVLNRIPYDRGDVLGLLALRNLLSANSGDVNVDLDDLKAMLKGYTVEERQNPYLDDPNLDDAGHPTVSFHD